MPQTRLHDGHPHLVDGVAVIELVERAQRVELHLRVLHSVDPHPFAILEVDHLDSPVRDDERVTGAEPFGHEEREVEPGLYQQPRPVTFAPRLLVACEHMIDEPVGVTLHLLAVIIPQFFDLDVLLPVRESQGAFQLAGADGVRQTPLLGVCARRLRIGALGNRRGCALQPPV